jgi:hypothetical protein
MQGLIAGIVSSREERQTWLGALKAEVSSMRQDMRADARDRKSFVKSLQSEVGEMRQELSSDLEGARQAWREMSGTPVAPRPSRSGKRTRRSR